MAWLSKASFGAFGPWKNECYRLPISPGFQGALRQPWYGGLCLWISVQLIRGGGKKINWPFPLKAFRKVRVGEREGIGRGKRREVEGRGEGKEKEREKKREAERGHAHRLTQPQFMSS